MIFFIKTLFERIAFVVKVLFQHLIAFYVIRQKFVGCRNNNNTVLVLHRVYTVFTGIDNGDERDGI